MNKVSRKMEADHEEPYEIVCDDPQYLENAIFRCSLQDENCGSFGSKLVKFCRLFFWVFCLPPRPQAITNKLAFAPPKAAYKFVKKGEADGHQPILDILFSLQVKYATMLVINGQEVHQTQGDLRSDVQLPNYAKQKVQGFKILGSESKNAVAVAHITQSEDAPFTILYSHGNSCDFGHTLHFLSVLCTVTRCNLITYDYSGFGESTGSPSEQGMYADHYATYQFLLSKFNLTPDRVILFGHSIGTVAAVELATRVDVAGVILEAPLLSGWKVMHESNCVKKHVNPFPSDIRAPKVKAPVLVMHGTDDDIIYMEDGAELCKRFRTAVEPLFIRGAGHNNMCW
ncbi:unnamed protein product [Notodromas monacha]|uniref:Protein ABHD13 n=1 Tax=Notodromas monacha TaxID=399045 RepID=A0A7R9BVV9_9CRUS|nr:unnamed protein product [Notodromas monacha]CAG0921192.1 unnamed protein product [Notodromas monacha]